jgi:hypothetical protein
MNLRSLLLQEKPPIEAFDQEPVQLHRASGITLAAAIPALCHELKVSSEDLAAAGHMTRKDNNGLEDELLPMISLQPNLNFFIALINKKIPDSKDPSVELLQYIAHEKMRLLKDFSSGKRKILCLRALHFRRPTQPIY